MAKSFKYKDNNFLDSTGIVHNKILLSEILEPILLWENDAPETSISEEKTIKLKSDDYEYLKVFYFHTTTNKWVYTVEMIKGYGTRFAIETLDGICYRTLNYVSDTEYTLSKIASNSPYTDLDRMVIPLYIIGYKNKLV